MANWGNLITKVGQLQGSRGTVTLGAKQMLAAAKKAGMSEKHLQEIGELLGKAKKPQVDIGYKVSDQGFTVAAARFRDGETVLGNGAASVTGLGTETPLFKLRMSVGEKGKYYTGKGWLDLGGNYNIDDVAMNMSIKNGVWEASSHIGTFTACSGKLNAKATVDDIANYLRKNGEDMDDFKGMTSYQSVIDKANVLANDWLKYIREAVSGKQKPIYDETNKITNLKDEFVKVDFNKLKEKIKNTSEKKIDIKIADEIFNKYQKECKDIDIEKFKAFLDGYPGTGKKSVAEALEQFLQKNKKDIS